MPAPSYAAITEPVLGSSRPVSYHLAETWDGLYVPYALRLPSQDATGLPFVFLAYGNGGGGLEWLRGRVLPEAAVRDPLASQVRGLVGLKGSRYAILPVELRIESSGAGTGVAILRLVMMDSRLAQIKWIGEVVSDPMTRFSPALTANVAARFADLVLAP